MTIAVCHVSPEGVVLGADSTSSFANDNGMHYFDFTQKVFEVGESATVGVLTWGLGGLGDTSYRTLVALFADELRSRPAISISDIATRWIDRVWADYSSFSLVKLTQDLHAKAKHDPTANPPDPQQRTLAEEAEYENLRTALVVGFCIAGYVMKDRVPRAMQMTFDPLAAKPVPQAIHYGWMGWGVPNMIGRLVHGFDSGLPASILSSGKWSGTLQELNTILQQYGLRHATLPIRDAIDFVHSCIYSTIKGMKFSSMPQVCGGPIEIAVITTDRNFRWVRHKPWDAAILDGAL